jgi:hypothetical protein
VSAKTQTHNSQKDSPRTGKTALLSFVAVTIVIGALAWFLKEKNIFKNEKPFAVLKTWSEKPDDSGHMTTGFEWLHRQCHENLADRDVDGRLRKRGAEDLNRTGPRVWAFKLRPNVKWSDDGKPVTVQDYIRAWDLRKGVVTAEDFKRIKNIKSLDATSIAVELDGDEDQKRDTSALSSIWLSAIKESTAGSWSYTREFEGPCDGPYVIRKRSANEALLERNKQWYAYTPEMLAAVKIMFEDTSGKSSVHQKAGELFQKGLISFVEPDISSGGGGEQTATVSGRVYLEPKAHYLVVNPRGLLGGELTAFAHAAMNRGELSALVQQPKTLATMYRILPLSFAAYDDLGKMIYLPPNNLESVTTANKILGIDDAKVRTNVPAPFKRKLTIIASSSPELEPLAQRLSDRLGANYNITGEIIAPSDADQLPATWDVAFIDVELKDGVAGWASGMIKILNRYAPGRTDLVGKFSALLKEKTDGGVISRQALQLSADIDRLPTKSLVIVPLGQFGSEILLEDGVLDVSWIGDSKRDPDVSRARRMKTGSKG